MPAGIALVATIEPIWVRCTSPSIGAIVATNAIPAGMTGLVMIPLESPTPIRTPGILWRLGVKQAPRVQSFAVILRKTALGISLRQEGPG